MLGPPRRSHLRALLVLLSGSAVLYGLIVISLLHTTANSHRSDWARLHPSQQLDIGCFAFLLCWWIAYFSCSSFSKDHCLRWLQLFTLRSFLDGMSSHRGASVPKRGAPSNVEQLVDIAWRAEREAARAPRSVDANARAEEAHERALLARREMEEDQRDEALIREKARSSRDVQGIMIAVVVLLLTLVVIDKVTSTTATEYQMLIEGPIFAVALVIILMWGLSLDIFDTMLNSFQVDIREANDLRRYFYRKIGPLKALSGAVSYGYVGHALMPIFVLLVFSWFEPVVSGFGTALYVLFAYPYYFGYWAIHTVEPIGNFQEVPQEKLPRNWQKVEATDQIKRWVVNRDGDWDVPCIGSLEVSRSGENLEARNRVPWLLFGIFFVSSVVIMYLGN